MTTKKKQPAPPPSCAQCQFYRISANGQNGDCLRFPPTLNPNSGWQYPVVQNDDYCGEYAKGTLPVTQS